MHESCQALLRVALASSILVGTLLTATPVAPVAAAGTISGRVFQDFNGNGAFDTTTTIANAGAGVIGTAIDLGVAGVTVTAYAANGAAVGTTVSDAAGAYTLTTTDVGSGPYRVEFTTLPAGFAPSAFGADNGTSVQFASAGATGVDFAVNRPSDYCQNNPTLATSCYVAGNQVTGPNNALPVLVDFGMTAGAAPGASFAQYDTPLTHTLSINASQIGATYGLAFRRVTREVFAAAYNKRGTGFGPGGPGAIYRVTPAGAASVFATIPNAGADPHTDPTFLTDGAAFPTISKRSLGDMDLLEDLDHPNNDTLYVVNLNDRQLYAVPITTAVPSAIPLPLDLPGAAQACPAADVRPFGLGVNAGLVYVGLVCSAQTSQQAADLTGYLYTYNPATGAFGAAPAFEFPLDYTRGTAYFAVANRPADWNAWTDTYNQAAWETSDGGGFFAASYPQPLVSDITFENGNLVLGLRDRGGEQLFGAGNRPDGTGGLFVFGIAAGDVLRACGSPSTGWTLEANGRCGGDGTAPQNTGQGPGNGEFFFEDDYQVSVQHDETALGGIAYVAGFPDVAVTAYDTIRDLPLAIDDAGVSWFNLTSGAQTKAYRLINGDTANPANPYFGKAGGLGDLEALCNLAPIEVGNRVWRDANANGVQDPGETDLAGVTVQLYRPGFGADGIAGNSDDALPLATAVTDAAGQYYFSSAPGVNAPNARYNLGLLPNTAYELRLDNAADYATGPLAGLTPTVAHAAPELRDSDGVPSGASVVAGFSTGGAGANNHTYDFGFSPAPAASPLSLGNQVWFDDDNDGVRDPGEALAANVLVRLFQDDGDAVCEPDADDAFLSDQLTDANGLYLFSNLSAENYCVQIAEGNFAGGPLTGFVSSTGGGSEPAGDPDADTDNRDDGTQSAGQGVLSAVVTLAPAAEPLAEDPDNDALTPDGNENLTVDFGVFQPYSLGNRVWFDADDDGQFEAGELGVPGVTVRLLDATATTVLAATTTAAGGCYRFDQLPAGDYVVEVGAGNFLAGGPLTGFASSTPDEADPNSDLDRNDNGLGTTPSPSFGVRSAPVTLGAGNLEPQGEADLCAGDQGTDNRRANMTVDFGFVAPPYSLGNRVWFDVDNSGDINGAEVGVANVAVRLLDATATTVLSTTVTGALGCYRFDNLLPGDYVVEVGAANFLAGQPLAGYNSSTPDAGDPDADADDRDDNGLGTTPDPGFGVRSALVTLGPGAVEPVGETDLCAVGQGAADDRANMTVDFGFLRPQVTLSLGNLVWNDLNDSGDVDPGEPGLAGVTVTLYRDTNANGAYDPGVDTTVAVTATNASGNYLFLGLTPGDYVVVVDPTSPALTGFVSSTGGVGAPFEPAPDPDDDLNDDDNGSASPNGVVAQAVTLAAGSEPTDDADTDPNTNLTVDFGFVQPPVSLSLGNLVWLDLNADGLADPGEPGLGGVVLSLFADTNPNGIFEPGTDLQVLTTTTNASGLYLFTGLPAGGYFVEAALPAGTTSTTDTANSATPNSDTNNDDNGAGNGAGPVVSGLVTLTQNGEPVNDGDADNDSNLSVDFGVTPAVLSLGNLVWIDANNNGAVDDGATPGLAGVTVNLYRDSNNDNTPDGGAIRTTTTDGNGNYLFPGLTPDTYLVEVLPPAGYVSSTGGAGAPYEPAPDPDGDLNDDDNGTATGGLIRAAAVTLTLNAEPITDGDLDNNSNLSVDFGLHEIYSLGNRVWLDLDDDGQLDPGEQGVAGVTVRLLDGAAATVLSTTTTVPGGCYRFDRLLAGDYVVEVGAANFTGAGVLTGHNSSTPDAGDPDTDGDDRDDNGQGGLPDPGFGVRSAPVTVGAGPSEPVAEADVCAGDQGAIDDHANMTVDFGFYLAASIGDRVWLDVDGDGVQGGAEAGVAGVTVTLLNGVGTVITSTVTNGTGGYAFTGLRPGDYAVRFTPPLNHVLTRQDQGGNDATDSDADPVTGRTITTTLVSGENDPTWDAGLVPVASLGNFVWEDANRNGVQDGGEPGLPGVTVRLLDPTGATVLSTTTTAAGGLYAFTNLLPGDYRVEVVPPSSYLVSPPDQGGNDSLDSDIDPATGRTIATTLTAGENDPTWDAGLYRLAALGNFVWEDTNGNGVQDGGEPGLSGVTVRLLDPTGATVLSTTTTAAGGVYGFANLPPGDYRVEFVPLAGYGVSPPDQGGNDSLDSDPDPATGRTGLINLVSGETDPTVDAGLVRLARLGNRVWLDPNGNGLQEPGETTGVANVTVQVVNLAGTVISTTTTDGSGNYQFVDLYPGDYRVVFTPPAGQALSRPNQGVDDTADSDPDPFTRRTAVINLSPGEDDPTVDAGLHPAASVGNYVWVDDDGDGVFDPGEPGMPNVTVRLYLPGTDGQPGTTDDVLVLTDTTTSTGFFQFSGLPTGDYFFHVTPPPGYLLTDPNRGGDDNSDSDVDPVTGRTAVINLLPGENDLTWDAGLVVDPTAVELLYFRVDAVAGAQVTLAWATAAEINNLGFRIMRAASPNLAEAAEVAFVPAAGAGANGAEYGYVDQTPAAGVWWYWLVDVDTDGTETAHGPVQTGLGAGALPVRVYLPLIQK